MAVCLHIFSRFEMCHCLLRDFRKGKNGTAPLKGLNLKLDLKCKITSGQFL